MKKHLAIAIGLLLGMYASEAFGQSCYSSAYRGAEAEPFALAASTQTYTVQVPVTVTVEAQRVAVAAPQPVAAPAPCQQSFAAPAPCAQQYGYAPVAVPFVAAYPQHFGFSAGFSYGHNVGFAQRGYVSHGGFASQGFSTQRFAAAGGSNIVARDRRGTAVSANFNNNVRINRGLFGNIKSVTTDANRGLFGRISPF